jgi:hypothetical protein
MEYVLGKKYHEGRLMIFFQVCKVQNKKSGCMDMITELATKER